MSRTIPAASQAAVSGLETEGRVVALEITHPTVTPAIRVVQDDADHTIEGNTYQAVHFAAAIPQDEEGEIPQGQLRIDNVGRELVSWVERSNGGRGATVRIMVVERQTASVILWEARMGVGKLAVTGEHVTVRLSVDEIWGRPAVKRRHDASTSPELF